MGATLDDDEAAAVTESAEAEGVGASEAECRERRVDAGLMGLRLDKALTLLAPEFSRSHLQGLIEAGHVRLDGAVAGTASRKLRAGQLLAVDLVPPAESRAFVPQDLPLDVLYEDEHLLVVNKSAGMVVHPAAGNWSGTLLNAVLWRDPAAAQLPRAGIVHRLDKDTSGVMVVGRSLPAVTALVRDIAARVVKRRYLALAHGDVGAEPFIVEAPVGRDPSLRTRMAVVASGKPARTDITPVATRGGISAVRCALHTGRTHQIRVHLAHEGHPLVADALYGGRAALGMARQALHATELAFEHPITREPLRFECPPPADFAAAWARVAGD
jgi:23S rRNA pseudouridine1911/1915/1917 synthase